MPRNGKEKKIGRGNMPRKGKGKKKKKCKCTWAYSFIKQLYFLYSVFSPF